MKILKLIFASFLALSSFTTYALDSCVKDSTTVFFVNGIMNSRD